MIKGRLVSIDCRLLSPADSFLPLQQLFDKFVRLADFNPQMLHILGLAYFELALLMSNALASKAAELNKLNKGLFHFLFFGFHFIFCPIAVTFSAIGGFAAAKIEICYRLHSNRYGSMLTQQLII